VHHRVVTALIHGAKIGHHVAMLHGCCRQSGFGLFLRPRMFIL
jgi:hypothetical protein